MRLRKSSENLKTSATPRSCDAATLFLRFGFSFSHNEPHESRYGADQTPNDRRAPIVSSRLSTTQMLMLRRRGCRRRHGVTPGCDAAVRRRGATPRCDAAVRRRGAAPRCDAAVRRRSTTPGCDAGRQMGSYRIFPIVSPRIVRLPGARRNETLCLFGSRRP